MQNQMQSPCTGDYVKGAVDRTMRSVSRNKLLSCDNFQTSYTYTGNSLSYTVYLLSYEQRKYNVIPRRVGLNSWNLTFQHVQHSVSNDYKLNKLYSIFFLLSKEQKHLTIYIRFRSLVRNFHDSKGRFRHALWQQMMPLRRFSVVGWKI